jgi:hypothetical protein
MSQQVISLSLTTQRFDRKLRKEAYVYIISCYLLMSWGRMQDTNTRDTLSSLLCLEILVEPPLSSIMQFNRQRTYIQEGKGFKFV